MNTPELQKAIDSLQIEDVYLRSSSASCGDDFDPKHNVDSDRTRAELKYWVKQSEVVELTDQVQLLRVFVEAGSRWLDRDSSADSPTILALIEGEFIAEYRIKESLDQACIDEFVLKNVSYHVWPYWRELLASHCERMRLPRLVLPAVQLAHNRLTQSKESGEE